MSVYWAATTNTGVKGRITVGVPLRLLIGVGLPEALQWINKREIMAKPVTRENAAAWTATSSNLQLLLEIHRSQ
jgi:hypothetical protein